MNINIPLDNLEISNDKDLQKIRDIFEQQEVFDILNKPIISREDKKITIKLLINLDPPNYTTGNWNLYVFVSLKAVLLSLEYGNATESVKAYANYGLILGTTLGDYQTGYKFGSLAYKLSQKLQTKQQQCKVNLLLGGWLTSWNESIHDAEKIALDGYQAGLESGEILFAGYNLFSLGCILYFKGTKLQQIQKEISNWLPFVEKTKNFLAFETLSVLQFNTFQLLGNNNSSISYREYQSPFAIAIYHIYQCQILYLLEQADESLSHALEAEKLTLAIAGFITSGEYYFYIPLVFIKCLPLIPQQQHNSYWDKIHRYDKKLKELAEKCPQNFQQKYLLLQAEISRINRDFVSAIDNYDKAIKATKANEYIQEEALANELTAKFYLDWGKEKIAAMYLQEAYYCYTRWGSKVKTDDLEKRYPQLLTSILKTQTNSYQIGETDLGNYQNTHTTRSSSTSMDEVLDFTSILKASQALSSEIKIDNLISQLMQLVIENAGAQKAALILLKDNCPIIKAFITTSENIKLIDIPCSESEDIPNTIINYVKRNLEKVLLDDATTQNQFISDSYLIEQKPKSLLCMPILNQGKLVGLLYLENNLTIGVFTQKRVEILNLLCSQAAISFENAELYSQLEDYSHTLEQKVEQRTKEVTQALKKLKSTQAQLIQTEKMSGLGQLVAGIAHEINNPISFIYGNLNPANEYVKYLIELINLYQNSYTQPLPEIESKIEDIELDYLIDDLPKLLNSMTTGAERIRDIVISLRNFSRLDEAEIKSVDIHSGIDSTLLIVQHQLNSNEKYPEIQIIRAC